MLEVGVRRAGDAVHRQAVADGQRARVLWVHEGDHLVASAGEETACAVTVSIGVACYDPGEPLAQLVQRADSALYQAKKTGRDRVVAA